LNDAFRQNLRGGKVVTTPRLSSHPDLGTIRNRVRPYTAFGLDNDPHGKHDFGPFLIGGDRIFWKIEYYDKSLTRDRLIRVILRLPRAFLLSCAPANINLTSGLGRPGSDFCAGTDLSCSVRRLSQTICIAVQSLFKIRASPKVNPPFCQHGNSFTGSGIST
jgi:hypothetical protein